MFQKITLVLVGCFFSMNLLAQELSGVIRDAVKNQPVFGATIRLKNARIDQQTTSDPSGLFSFENLQYGYYTLEVIAQGYENQTITEIEVKAARDVNIELSLQPSSIVLNELPITYALPSGRRPLQPIGEIPLSRDQTLRLPSMYFDPARLAAAYPGVAQTEDGTNALNIRGNSPSSVRWRLEGTEIVNPNHLPNAGTFSDGPAAASGGVLMFSAQMLDNSSLLTGSLPAGYGDAIGGIFDMNLRTGNATRHQFTAQAGLV
ncbi:MAG: carboxypeptidase-like regulatory domain-containing protein, partial [Saprospiraceae bacterium]|nr:carboxypeptidase-like regulatory domain-containing protein [Saprospiraceae bacterium]